MRLFITEKPSVAMDVAKALGGAIVRQNGFVQVGEDWVTWCVGHLIGQATPEAYGEEFAKWDVNVLPIVPEEWKMVPNERTADQLKVVGGLIKKATTIINCGDSAREGQLIVDELLEYFQYSGQTMRMWLQEMNQSAILKAIGEMKNNQEYKNLYLCALARSRADWLMGMNLTRAYSKAWQSKGNRGTLHIGRVQTPTLCLIVGRDYSIEQFKPTDYFVLRVKIEHQNGIFDAAWVPPKDSDFLDASGRLINKKVAESIAQKTNKQPATVTLCETKAKTQSPPLPFSLGDLQKACNKSLGLSPSETLAVAQALYEKHKLTTYPRTDYAHLPEDEFGLSPKIIEAAKTNFGADWDFPGTPDFNIKTSAWDSSKIGDHHGIRPTLTRNHDLSTLSKTEFAVYKLIVRNFLAQFYKQYGYDATSVEITCATEVFKASGTVETESGWKVLFRTNNATEEKEEVQNLPAMVQGDGCTIQDTKIESKKTSPPQRFDGALIIDAMEKAYLYVTDERVKQRLKETGIGTPATRAAIIESLLEREYIQEQKEGKRKVYVSTAKGRLLYNAVPPQLRNPDITAYFEELLKAIERGELPIEKFMAHQMTYITKLIDDVKSGKVAESMPKLEDCEPPPLKKRSSKGEPKEKKCPKCKSVLKLRNGAKGNFMGCSGYPICKYTEEVK